MLKLNSMYTFVFLAFKQFFSVIDDLFKEIESGKNNKKKTMFSAIENLKQISHYNNVLKLRHLMFKLIFSGISILFIILIL